MSNVIKGKAKITVNGIVIGEYVDYIQTIDFDPKNVVDYVECKIPRHICNQCGDEWTWSTNDNKCMICEGENITHE